ncbi:23S rRNA (guanosine(2251)-2'-O)-methyltransferase RlmB [Rickettsia endosymbiont of Halotydeus destructor]|uniref:23S rRNA (guanosine(2251)-2'-O)-methyltransferase RlmB n=1 Tax=Rickettsia endosymbiont of Halotydeus destructor TaxID=2996754 RepID=UPI003BB0978D
MRNKETPSKNFYYLYGKHPVYSALKNPKRQIDSILCTDDIFKNNKELISLHPYKIIANNDFSKYLGLNQVHQGIAAKVKTIFSDNIKDIDATNPNCKIAILDQITDPQNIGAIIRSAAGFEINTIILPSDNSPDENATIAKAASGTLELVQIIKVTNLRMTMEYLKKQGFWIVGLDAAGVNSFNDKLLSDKIVVVLGSEDKGIRKLVRETCDYLVKIPISNKVESLNVSNAASIVFHSLYIKHSK